MLTSPGNQYLRPEYLTPLPTTLDAKKSPLALLAQTCSQIGSDSPNSKLLQSANDKSHTKNKSTPINVTTDKDKNESFHSQSKSHHITGSKPYDLPREKSRSPEERSNTSSTGSRVRTPQQQQLSSSASIKRCGSNQSATSPRASPASISDQRKTPLNNNIGVSPLQNLDGDKNGMSSSTTLTSTTSTSTSTAITTPKLTSIDRTNSPSQAQLPSVSATQNAFTPNILTSSSDPAIKDLPLGTFKPGAVPVSSSAFLNYSQFSSPIDLMANSLMSPHHHATLKSGTLSPYLNYGRMKSGEPLPTVCRDPYCTGCSMSSHLLGSLQNSSAAKPTTCPTDCTQCDHSKTIPSPIPPTSTAATNYLASAAYAHAHLAALAAASQQLPYVCNWVSGDASYCGKRFANSEELLSHLRTHTSTSSISNHTQMMNSSVSDTHQSTAALSMLGAAAAAAAAASSSLPPTHPLLHHHRAFSTSPLSPLSAAAAVAAAARYHPYGKPPTTLLPHPLPPTSAAYPSLAHHPGLPPYLSHYSLYGGPPRLGAAPGMHP